MTLQSRAILLMIAAVFCFSIMDAGVKAVTPQVGVLPALWARYAGQMLLVFLLVLPRLKQVTRTRYPRLQVLRSILLMSATGFFFTGISLIPLTDAAALMATNPVLITLGAALFLGERLGPRRVVGIVVALFWGHDHHDIIALLLSHIDRLILYCRDHTSRVKAFGPG